MFETLFKKMLEHAVTLGLDVAELRRAKVLFQAMYNAGQRTPLDKDDSK
jgi:hypothetical protein